MTTISVLIVTLVAGVDVGCDGIEEFVSSEVLGVLTAFLLSFRDGVCMIVYMLWRPS